MTFTEAREKQLKKLRYIMDELHRHAADPEWNNENCTNYKRLMEELGLALRRIRALNGAEWEAKR